MEISIDRTTQTPIYLQVARQIRTAILSGALPAGFRLPPERRLARSLGINRSTVLNAYDELKADGLVEAHVGRGTIVMALQPTSQSPEPPPAMPWRQIFRSGPPRSLDPMLRDLLELTERDDVISLSIGLPAPELIPAGEYNRVLDELTRQHGAPLFLHCPTEGHTSLRTTLSRWLVQRGICCDPADVLILSGSQQGLDLAARVFLNPGDAVIVEEPSYFGALQVFRGAQARLIGVPIDGDGMRTDILATILEHQKPKLIYTLPTFQNPSGTVMSLERRRQLLDLAARYQVPVLEDDPYSELIYDGDPLPSLKALDRHGIVVYLGTFSKILFPGLRIGWLVAPRPVTRQFALVKQSADLHSNTPAQWVLDQFIRDGIYDRHIRRLRTEYAHRRDVMDAALQRLAPDGLIWETPRGGFYFWCRLPDGIDRFRLVSRAAETGVSVLPGWACYPEEPGESYLRLNFSHLPPDDLEEGVSRLMSAVRDAIHRVEEAAVREIGTLPIV